MSSYPPGLSAFLENNPKDGDGAISTTDDGRLEPQRLAEALRQLQEANKELSRAKSTIGGLFSQRVQLEQRILELENGATTKAHYVVAAPEPKERGASEGRANPDVEAVDRQKGDSDGDYFTSLYDNSSTNMEGITQLKEKNPPHTSQEQSTEVDGGDFLPKRPEWEWENQESRAIAALERKHASEIARLLGELNGAKQLAADQSEELLALKVLKKVDTLPIPDIITKVRDLNEEIFRVANSLSKLLSYHVSPYSFRKEGLDEARREALELIGPRLVGVLEELWPKTKSKINVPLVQLTLQVLLASFCNDLVRCWYLSDNNVAQVLSQIYLSMNKFEDPSLSRRWRALTLEHSRLSSDMSWDSTALDRQLQSVFRIAHWELPATVNIQYICHNLFGAVQSLRIALGEGHISGDIDAFVVMANSQAVFQPAYMEDAFLISEHVTTHAQAARVGVIVGSVGIGLKRATQRAYGERVTYQNIAPVKVVLEPALREILK